MSTAFMDKWFLCKKTLHNRHDNETTAMEGKDDDRNATAALQKIL
jgi:hypothetical protein